VRETLFTAPKGWIINSDSYLSTHSRPGAQLVLSLLSFYPPGTNILKYLFIWMCSSILAQLFSCVTLVELQRSQWLYASWEPGLTGVRKCCAYYRGENCWIFLLLSRHTHLRETDLAAADGRNMVTQSGPCFPAHRTTCEPQCEVKSELNGQREET